MLKIKSVLKNLFFSLFLICFASCELFQNDVVDYMEQFTGTAAIEDHEFNVATYKDAIEQLCISSEQDSEIVFFMRNPKKYVLEPSVTFEALDSAISRSAVQIIQTDADTLTLSLPLEFLIAADEGKDISAQIELCEPATGREFEPYSVSLHCNTVPPVILNPTIINNNNTSFIVAFDMPSPEEVALRHKDICEIVIGGQSFPVKITTVADPDVEGAYKAVYEIQDERFTTEFSTDFTFIREKSFAHNDGTSFYFETEQPYNQGDKEYTLVLKDSAGLSSSVKASTSVAKLQKPVIINQNNTAIVEGRMTGIPYTEETKTGAITIYPPTKDHFGNDVSGARIYYRVYELTGSGRVYTSGTSREPVTLELPQNTYRVEAYATLWNYENSATTKVKFRFMNNVINLRACSDPEGFVGDGSEGAPYASFAEVIADINSREPRDVKYTVNVEGDFTVNTYSKDAETGLVSYGSYGDIVLAAVDTDEFIIQKNPKASEAKLKSITLESTLDSSLKVLVDGIEINNSASSGIKNASGVELTIKNITVSGASGYGIEVTSGTVILNSGTVSSNGYGGAGITGGTFTLAGGSLTSNSQGIISTGTGIVNVTGGSVSSNSGWGIYQIGGTINLSGGSISGNQQGGVQQTGVVKVSGKPYVYNNYDVSGDRCDIQVPSGKNITVAGALTFGARIGVKLDSGRTPTAIGDQYSFTSGYSNTDSPSNYFISDDGFAIIRVSGGEAMVALSGSSGTFPYSIDDFNFSYAISTNAGVTNVAQTVTITPTITRSEMGGGTTTLTYNDTDHKLYAGAVPASDQTVTITAGLYDGVVKTDTLTVTPNGSGDWVINIPGKLTGNYIIKLNVMFYSENCGATFVYNVANP